MRLTGEFRAWWLGKAGEQSGLLITFFVAEDELFSALAPIAVPAIFALPIKGTF
jgi:hypothetical protein